METCVSYVTISLMPNLVRVVIVQCAVNVLLGPGNVRLAVYVGGKYNYIVCFRFPGLTAVCINLAAANQNGKTTPSVISLIQEVTLHLL